MILSMLLPAGLPANEAQANEANVFGAIIGAATGGFIGSNIGNGNGRLAATAAGTLLGAIIGHNMGTTANHHDRYGTGYSPTYRGNVHKRPVYRPAYATPWHSQKPHVVIHKRTVIIKHVPTKTGHHWRSKQWRKKKWEVHRRKQGRVKAWR